MTPPVLRPRPLDRLPAWVVVAPGGGVVREQKSYRLSRRAWWPADWLYLDELEVDVELPEALLVPPISKPGMLFSRSCAGHTTWAPYADRCLAAIESGPAICFTTAPGWISGRTVTRRCRPWAPLLAFSECPCELRCQSWTVYPTTEPHWASRVAWFEMAVSVLAAAALGGRRVAVPPRPAGGHEAGA